MKPVSRLLYFLLASTLALLVLTALYRVSSDGMRLWKPDPRMPRTELLLKEGEGLHHLLARLGEMDPEGSSRWPVKVYARATGIDRDLQAGRYDLGPEWSPVQVLEQTALGPNAPHKVVLSPGLTLRQIAQRFQKAGWVDRATAFIEAASGPGTLKLYGRPTLEGLLAPDTYFFDAPEEPSTVVRKLHERWKSEIELLAGTSELAAHLRNGLTLYDTVVLASLVEKEAADRIEMATVASVFHNRLRKNWPMGSSATLRYALHDWSREENRLPTKLKSPFNTNRKAGLPPHPICVPSREAMQAAIHPADTPYFFFVADGEGKTRFTVTHKEHIRAARDYRRKMREKKNEP